MEIGIPKEYFDKGIDPEVKKSVMEAVGVFKKNGFEIKQISLPNSQYGIAVYYLVQATEVASNLGRYDGIRYGNDRSSFGAEAKRRIMLGTFASSAGYSAKFFEKAARVRTLISQDFEKAFNQVDLILAPVSPTPPFKLGEKANDPLQMYLSDILTVPVNLAGLPALALPCGFSKSGLPVGMQLIGPRWGEEWLFEVGEKYQELTEWHKLKPQNSKRKVQSLV
jgi:aspartyl-tRNA(Asn)/glutamyl-tRNA(Gln) amidotransferase subunit A